MYGFLALAYDRQGQYPDYYYCVDQMELILSYVLNKDEEEGRVLDGGFMFYVDYAYLYGEYLVQEGSEKERADILQEAYDSDLESTLMMAEQALYCVKTRKRKDCQIVQNQGEGDGGIHTYNKGVRYELQ